jgi:hypothetical protein
MVMTTHHYLKKELLIVMSGVVINVTQSLNTRPRCSKSSNISKLAQAGDSKIAPLSIKVLATLTAASIELE